MFHIPFYWVDWLLNGFGNHAVAMLREWGELVVVSIVSRYKRFGVGMVMDKLGYVRTKNPRIMLFFSDCLWKMSAIIFFCGGMDGFKTNWMIFSLLLISYVFNFFLFTSRICFWIPAWSSTHTLGSEELQQRKIFHRDVFHFVNVEL